MAKVSDLRVERELMKSVYMCGYNRLVSIFREDNGRPIHKMFYQMDKNKLLRNRFNPLSVKG